MSGLSHSENHRVHRIGWLRAAVLGANDGLVSTASLLVGVAAAGSGRPEILIAGLGAGCRPCQRRQLNGRRRWRTTKWTGCAARSTAGARRS